MGITETLGYWLINFFTSVPLVGDAMAALLALSLVLAAVAIGIRYKKRHHLPLVGAIDRRIARIDQATGGPLSDVYAAREGFARDFNDIDIAMMEADHEQSFALRRVWEEYRETIVDPAADVLQNTARPEHFFLNLGDRHRGLNWFANIFIAVGLLITFLGIIAALSSVEVRPAAERRHDGRARGPLPADLPAKTPLAVIIDGDQGKEWKDDEAGALEAKLVEVVAGTIVAGEAAFRRRLREAELRAEQFRAMEERRRRERSEALAAERLKKLRESGELLRQAEDLRALLARVRGAVQGGSLAVEAADLEAWGTWASNEADRLDPVLSGHVMDHILPPDDER